MKYDPARHHRRSIRVKGYDYTQPGAYFVTLVAWQRECIFGDVVDGEMHLNGIGEIVNAAWMRLPGFFPSRVDEWVIMPNHIHGILFILEVGAKHLPAEAICDHDLGGKCFAPTHNLPIGAQPGSQGAMVQNFKSVSSRKINQLRSTPGSPVWQGDYFERIIRDELELNHIRQYIQDNPLNWSLDQENPAITLIPKEGAL